jgi:hypothetical protein
VLVTPNRLNRFRGRHHYLNLFEGAVNATPFRILAYVK